MPNWLCKIWQVVSNLLGKIVKFVTDVLDSLVNLAVKAIKGVVDAVTGGGSLFNLLLLGVGAYVLVSLLAKKSDGEDATVARSGATAYGAPPGPPLLVGAR